MDESPPTDDQLAEENFVKSTARAEDGSYIVTMPLIEGAASELGNSSKACYATTKSMYEKLSPHNQQRFISEIQTLIDGKYLERVPSTEVGTGSYYIPMFPVINENSATHSFRIVLNSAQKSSN